MGFDVGVMNVEYLERPRGIVYEFIVELAISAGCSGEGNAFGFFSKGEMEERMASFLEGNAASQEQVKELEQWVESLPWSSYGGITLSFNW